MLNRLSALEGLLQVALHLVHRVRVDELEEELILQRGVEEAAVGGGNGARVQVQDEALVVKAGGKGLNLHTAARLLAVRYGDAEEAVLIGGGGGRGGGGGLRSVALLVLDEEEEEAPAFPEDPDAEVDDPAPLALPLPPEPLPPPFPPVAETVVPAEPSSCWRRLSGLGYIFVWTTMCSYFGRRSSFISRSRRRFRLQGRRRLLRRTVFTPTTTFAGTLEHRREIKDSPAGAISRRGGSTLLSRSSLRASTKPSELRVKMKQFSVSRSSVLMSAGWMQFGREELTSDACKSSAWPEEELKELNIEFPH
ncbi:hypothetical protein TYRP_004132 [Tyrophagus putrescentiae]|nr:hypothetical protein TYRP_004132 [Tyrophagus putrescentiae]